MAVMNMIAGARMRAAEEPEERLVRLLHSRLATRMGMVADGACLLAHHHAHTQAVREHMAAAWRRHH
jgi:hypothetical protein